LPAFQSCYILSSGGKATLSPSYRLHKRMIFNDLFLLSTENAVPYYYYYL